MEFLNGKSKEIVPCNILMYVKKGVPKKVGSYEFGVGSLTNTTLKIHNFSFQTIVLSLREET
jgi:hypothetical protein